jgi:hypothetical protein
MSEKNYLKEALFMIIVGVIIAAIANEFFIQKVSVEPRLTPNKSDSMKNSKNTYINKTDPTIEEGNETSLQIQKIPKENNNGQHESIEKTNYYINSTIINSKDNVDVSVTVIDENEHDFSSVSSEIANIYIQKGKRSNYGLLRSSFIHKKEFQELFEGNSDIILNLGLKKYTDYLVLGKISYSMQKGKLVDGTIVCVATITINIISANANTITKSFTFSVVGNGLTEFQAKEYAIQKMLDIYQTEYSSL